MKAVIVLIVLSAVLLGVSAKCGSYDHNSFYWKMCSSTNSVVTALDLSPSPIVLGENITLSLSGKLGTTITNNTATGAPYSITLELFKDEVIWVNLCDFVNCNVPDICLLMEQKVNAETCAILKSHGLPCGCPLNAASYTIQNMSFGTKNPNISWLTDGHYCATATIQDAKGTVIGCLEAYALMSASK